MWHHSLASSYLRLSAVMSVFFNIIFKHILHERLTHVNAVVNLHMQAGSVKCLASFTVDTCFTGRPEVYLVDIILRCAQVGSELTIMFTTAKRCEGFATTCGLP